MSLKPTFKEWFANFFRGIWQALCRVGRAFNPKYKTPFWRVIWAVIASCILFFTCIVGYSWYREEYLRPLRYCNKQRISPQIDFVRPADNRWKGWTQNVLTGEVITKDVDWVALSADEDSLIVFSSKGKRGYINRYSGKVSIPAKYRKAWIFSSGVAGVIESDSVFFIDHSGKPINDRKFKFNAKTDGYVYHGNYCAIAVDGGLMGLIDKSGNWAVLPEYDYISPQIRNFWKMSKGTGNDKLWYAFDDMARQVTDDGYMEIEITQEYGVIATLPDNLMFSFGFDGHKSDAFFLRDIETMYYETDDYDENGEKIYAPTTLKIYSMPNGNEGLCTASGRIVTKPIYCEIRSAAKDLYLCKLGRKIGVLINSKGEIIKQTEELQ